MPTTKPEPIRPGSVALIVGNGPSRNVVPWPSVWRQLADRMDGRWADVFLMNALALGRVHGKYAVAVGPEVLRKYVRAGLQQRGRIVTGDPAKIVGAEAIPEVFGEILQSSRSQIAPEDWPPHASGPLAVWTASAMGYETICLFGLDGRAGPPQEATDWNARAATWEYWIREYEQARGGLPGKARLIRVWPVGFGVPRETDPLAYALADTVYVRIEAEDGTACPI